MGTNYEDWADWAGDHHEQVEAERRRAYRAHGVKVGDSEECEHAEVSPSGYCVNCGDIVAGWEPDDAQMLTQSGTKEPVS